MLSRLVGCHATPVRCPHRLVDVSAPVHRLPRPVDDAGEPEEGTSRAALQPVDASIGSIPVRELCVTQGKLGARREHRAVIHSPSLLAIAPAQGANTRPSASISREVKWVDDGRFESDIEHQQLGLQLLHRNACNTAHVSWRLSERSFVTASIQSNPVVTQEADCHDQRQRDLRPFWRAATTFGSSCSSSRPTDCRPASRRSKAALAEAETALAMLLAFEPRVESAILSVLSS